MARSPQYKVYDNTGKYQAACHDVAAAAILVSFYGDGATIRLEHRLAVWTEGVDGTASESYDKVQLRAMEKPDE